MINLSCVPLKQRSYSPRGSHVPMLERAGTAVMESVALSITGRKMKRRTEQNI